MAGGLPVLEDLPRSLLTLWPKLKPALRVLQKRGGTGAILFVGTAQALQACRRIARAVDAHCEELPRETFTQSEFNSRVYNPIMKRERQQDLFSPSPARLCVILPNLDARGEWVHLKLKRILERPKWPSIILATAAHEKVLPTYLNGHFNVCRKKGAPRGSHHRRKR